MVDEIFLRTYSQVRQAQTKAAFEVRFNAIQKGVTERINKEIDKVNSDNPIRELEALDKRRQEMTVELELARAYKFGLETNSYRFLEINSDANAAVAAADADENSTFSADEVTALNEAKDQLAEKIRNLLQLQFPGFTDGNMIQRIRQDADTLDTLTAVEGVLDPEGTDPVTNDNRTLIDLMTEVSTRALTYSESTDTLVGAVNELIIDGNTELFDIEADATRITLVDVEKKTAEIDAIKTKYATLLEAIALSFEVTSGLGDMLSESLDRRPDKTSILNLFV